MDNYFEGYVRNDGTAGTRNYIGVVCSVICSSVIAKEISDQLPEAIPLIHSNGCAQLGDDFHVTKNMLVGVASNPNLYSALLVGLGCETNQISGLLDSIPKTKPIEGIGIQQLAGGENTIRKGVHIAEKWSEAAERNRERLPLSYLTVGIVTVDIDEESLEQVYPVVSEVIDRLVKQDAKVVMALTDRLEPAGRSLADRAEKEEVKARLSDLGSGMQRKRWKDANQELISPRPFSDQEKALAALEEKMSGTSPIKSLLHYNERPEGSGFYMTKASSNLVETLSNMASCGCNIALVVSSRGTLTGSIALPCMTLTPQSASGTFDELVDYTVTGEDFSIQARKVIQELLDISSGKQTKLEEFELGEFSIPHVGTTF
ncbi:UxaA family hydrolase [Halobacillus naozhouensis]|uniref:UxaA family hydrolase n=1 Tax=Halobacillus naozhouensis TaxID=554880 RepID=A0ABY8IZQ6_9BACI|nr:UxaA family hydrolase [Halobacillus naozhouensis]WFT74106.1 UxaA family hydrolase [Halobacillus naozhouensis]